MPAPDHLAAACALSSPVLGQPASGGRRSSVLLDSGKPVVATIAERGGGFIEEVKRRPGTELVTVTPANRDEIPALIVARIAKRHASEHVV